MTTKVDSYGLSKTYINDQLVQGLHYDATYDGNKLDLAIGDHEGDQIFIKMDNDDIMNLFTKHSSSAPLEHRISEDYGNNNNKNNIVDLLSPLQSTTNQSIIPQDAIAVISPFLTPKIETTKTRKKRRSRKKKTPSPKSKSKSKSKSKTKTKTKSPSYRKTDIIPSINKTVF